MKCNIFVALSFEESDLSLNIKKMNVRILLYLQVIFFLISCHADPGKKGMDGSDRSQSAGIPVVVSTVSTTSENKTLTLSGAAEAETSADIGFMVSGKVSNVFVKEGQKVKRGQLLASMVSTDYKLATDIANANLAKARDEYQRLTLMYNRGSLTASDYQTIKSKLAEAEARQQLAEKNVRDTRLYSPITGEVARRSVDPGEIVSQGMPVFSIVSISPVNIKASVPESEIWQIRRGQEAKVSVAALDSSFSGTITQLGAVADPTSRAYTVKISVPNRSQLIKPGMIADVKVSSRNKSNLIVVPGEAVLHDADQTTYVYVVDSARKMTFKRKVTTGNVFNNTIEISSGLKAGEVVVIGGQQKLEDGSFVQIRRPGK